MAHPPLSPRRVLYEDAALLAVDKPAGLVVHATVDARRDHLTAMLARTLVARDGHAGHLALVHRLDRGTSGVLVFSRAPAFDAPLGATFAQRRARKVYLALVVERGTARFPDATQRVEGFLKPNHGAGGRTVVVRAGGQPAQTSLVAIHRAPGIVLVRATPKTGRTHQIRVHLAELGFPILGDTLYGGADPDAKRLMLHAWRLTLPHPAATHEAPLHLRAPLPRAFRHRLPALPDGVLDGPPT